MTSIPYGGYVHVGSREPRGALLWRYRELMWMLAWRDIRVRYKHSLLGAAWAVLPPAAMMLIFTFVFGQVVQVERHRLTGSANVPYALFAFTGLVPWTYFANGLSGAITSLVSNRPLVTKIYFPREVFPISAVASAFVDFLVGLVVLAVLGVYLHFVNDGWRFEFSPMIFFLPVVVLVQTVLMVGLGMMLSMANLFYRDVGFVFRSIIQLWMFITCVVYQLEATAGWKRILIQANPMTPIIRAYRDCLIAGQWPIDGAFLWATVASILALVGGWRWFRRREHQFAETI